MLGVDEAGDPAGSLGLSNHRQDQGGLAGAVGAVDLGDATPRDATYPEDLVQGQAAGRDGGWGRLAVGVRVEGDAGTQAAVHLGQRGV
jgi:hypothetical protein